MLTKYRYLVTRPHLNSHGTLHGGILMKWVDEACGMEARLLTGKLCATRHMRHVDFIATGRIGDIIEISVRHLRTGNTSIAFDATVRNALGGVLARFEEIIFVAVDKDHKAVVIKNEEK